MRRTFSVLTLLLFAGCVTTRLSPRGEGVRVTLNRDEVKGCRSLGTVEASKRRTGLFFGKSAAAEDVSRRLRNDAAKRGANVVLVASAEAAMIESRSRGEAYACT